MNTGKKNETNFCYSIIIPQRNSLHTLPRLFNSIPDRADIEIIVVDNSPNPVTREEIGIERDYQLIWVSPIRCAGGARNEGIDVAQGKWLIFSDADDFFTEDAFQIFDERLESDADIIYFCAQGIYPETGEKSNQADLYTNLVKNFLADNSKEINLRLSFHVPWAKMVKSSFVKEYNIRYDEVVANNDDFFALQAGYFARKIEAVNKPVYYYSVSAGSIMRRRSKEVMKARLEVILRCNKFKKEHGLGNYQCSIAYFLYEAPKYGIKTLFDFILLLIKYKQNPFIGCQNWVGTRCRIKVKEKREKKYLTRN